MYHEIITFIQVISLCYVDEFAFLLSQSQSLNSILDWNDNMAAIFEANFKPNRCTIPTPN